MSEPVKKKLTRRKRDTPTPDAPNSDIETAQNTEVEQKIHHEQSPPTPQVIKEPEHVQSTMLDEKPKEHQVEKQKKRSHELDTPSKTSKSKVNVQEHTKENVFYVFLDHVWPAMHKPLTLVVDSNPKHASSMLIDSLMNVDMEDSLREKLEKHRGDFKPSPLPLDGPGVAIMRIGLSEMSNPPRKFALPYIEEKKSKGDGDFKLFVCTDHYTSSATPAVTFVMAEDEEEAHAFINEVFQKLRIPNKQKTRLTYVNRDDENVYFLTPTVSF